MQDSTHSIFHSAKRFLAGTSLSRVSGFFRDVAMAYAFGTHVAIAAFFVAFRFSHLLRRLLGEGALQTAFIPQFELLRKNSPLRATLFFRDLAVLLTLLLGILIVITMGILQGFIAWGDLSPENLQIVHLTLLMMPSLLFICLFGVNASLLQCEKSYFTASFAPTAFNGVWIIGVLLLWNKPAVEAMPWLSLFIVAGCLIQWLITLPLTVKLVKKGGLLHPLKNIQLLSKDLRGLFKPLLLAIFGISAAQINNALDAIFARFADLEGPAILWYAIRIQQLPLALFGISISGALLPPLARAIKGNDLPAYKNFITFALQKSYLLMLPMTLAIFLLGDTAVQFIYGRGGFTLESSMGTTTCLWAYGLGLIPMTMILILGPAFYAQSDYRTPTIASFFSVLLNIALNALFVMVLDLGAASIALATSVSAFVNAAHLAICLRRKIGPLPLWKGIGKTTLAAFFATLALIALDALWLKENQAWQILTGNTPSYPEHFLQLCSLLFIQAAAFGAAFLAALYALGEPLFLKKEVAEVG